MSETIQGASTKPRGTILLEGFEKSLPKFNGLDQERHIEFSKAIHLLSHYFEITQSRLETEPLSKAQSMMHRLRQLHGEYIDKNEIIASAIFVVMAHIESYYLDDPDAKLVHNLTSLQIYRPIPLAVSSVRRSDRSLSWPGVKLDEDL